MHFTECFISVPILTLYSTKEITSNLSSAKMATKRFASHTEKKYWYKKTLTEYNCYSGSSQGIWVHIPCLCSINQRLSRACIVHLVIKRTNWSYVKTMSCSGSHLGILINIKHTKFVKDLPMIHAQFRFNQFNSVREEHISVFSPYGPVLIL